jgi:hypothetical protein
VAALLLLTCCAPPSTSTPPLSTQLRTVRTVRPPADHGAPTMDAPGAPEEGEPPEKAPRRGAKQRNDTRTNFAKLHAQGLPKDTPAFRRQIREEYENAVAFEGNAQKLVDTVDSYLASLGGISSLTACFDDVLQQQHGTIADPTDASGGRHEAAALLSSLTEMTEAFRSQVRAMVVDPVNEYLRGEVADAKQRYETYLESERRVDKTRQEYLSMKSETGREFLSAKEQALNADVSAMTVFLRGPRGRWAGRGGAGWLGG